MTAADGGDLTVNIIEPVAICPGLRRCHSSTRSLRLLPGISRGTNAPVDNTIRPSVFFLHFPTRIYSATSPHSRTKWSGPPQNMQRSEPLGSRRARGGSDIVEAWAGWFERALTKVSAIRSNMVAKSSALIVGSVGVPRVTRELSDEVSWNVEEVPWRMNFAASWMSCNWYGSSGKWSGSLS